MFARVLAAGGVLACMVFLAPAAPGVDQKPPQLRWHFDPQSPQGSTAVRVQLQASDDQSLSEITVTALGTFRCATRDGSLEAPFEVVVSLPTLQERYPIVVGQALQREAALVRPLALERIYCGRYRLNPEQGPVALYAKSGKVLLRARVRDHSGFEIEGQLRLELG